MKVFKWAGAGVVALCLTGFVYRSLYAETESSPNAVKAKHLNHAIRALSKGSNKVQVLDFLHKESLDCSWVSVQTELDFDSAVRDSGYAPADLSGYYVGIIRDVSKNFITSEDTQYLFFFDHNGRLLKATSSEVFTGP